MATWAVQDEWITAPEFRRLWIASAVAHAVGAVLLWWTPFAPRPVVLPDPIMVSVIDAPPPAAAPAPAAPKQRVKEVVIPDRPKAQPAPPKPKPPEPEPEPEPEPKQAPPPERPPSAEELLARLNQQVAQRPDAKPQEAQPAARGRFAPELALYKKRVEAQLRATWARSACGRREVSLHRVEISAQGAIRSMRLERSSGSRACDASGERALRKVRALPPPPKGALTLTVEFDPAERR